MFEVFNILFTNPTTNLLVSFYKVLSALGIPFSFGFSIIALTVAIRLILYPLTAAQIKSAYKMQKIAPHLKQLREKHKGDQKMQQQEMMRLYREHGVNPAAGCLPLIIQIPIIWGLYHVLTVALNINSAKGLFDLNKVLYADFLKLDRIWDTSFFGFALADSPSKLFGPVPLVVLVPVLTGVFQFILSKMMTPEEVISAKVEIAKKTEEKSDDFQAAFQKQSLFIFPVMIGFFSFTLPLGLSLYWNAFTIFGILQQYLLVGAGAATPYFKKIKLHGKSNKNN